MGRTKQAAVFVASGLAVVLQTPVVAGEPSQADKTAAAALFREGRDLLRAGKTMEACVKLAQSDDLDPEIGTHLNLALCHEAQGKTASAWVEFVEVADRAERGKDRERAAFAREHAEALEKKLSRVTLRVERPASNEVLEIDGRALGRAAWTTALSLDPGPHEFAARAPGKTPWTVTVAVAAGPSTQEVVVPVLEDAAADSGGALPADSPRAPPKVSAEAPRAEASTQDRVESGGGGRTLGFVVAGVGVAGLAVGSVFGLATLSKNADADKECGLPGGKCTQAGVDAGAAAKTDALVSTIGFGVGIVGLAAGVYLVLAARPARGVVLRVAPSVARSGAAVDARVSW